MCSLQQRLCQQCCHSVRQLGRGHLAECMPSICESTKPSLPSHACFHCSKTHKLLALNFDKDVLRHAWACSERLLIGLPGGPCVCSSCSCHSHHNVCQPGLMAFFWHHCSDGLGTWAPCLNLGPDSSRGCCVALTVKSSNLRKLYQLEHRPYGC